MTQIEKKKEGASERTLPLCLRCLTKRRHYLWARAAALWSSRSGFGVQALPLTADSPERVEDLLKASGGRRLSTGSSGVCFLGITVTKRVGNAVERNRIRRRLRAVSEQCLPFRGKDRFLYVLIGRRPALFLSSVQLHRDLQLCLRNLHRESLKINHQKETSSVLFSQVSKETTPL